MDESFENWTIQVRKGLLELCALRAIGSGESYGYDLVRTLVHLPGLGVAEGSIYPLLSRMRKSGWLEARLEESAEGPARKYYKLTASGRAHLAAMQVYFESVVEAVDALGRRPSDSRS